MTRGIKGANIFIVDEDFREYFKKALLKTTANPT